MNFDDEIKKSNIPLDTERTLKDLSYLIGGSPVTNIEINNDWCYDDCIKMCAETETGSGEFMIFKDDEALDKAAISDISDSLVGYDEKTKQTVIAYTLRTKPSEEIISKFDGLGYSIDGHPAIAIDIS